MLPVALCDLLAAFLVLKLPSFPAQPTYQPSWSLRLFPTGVNARSCTGYCFQPFALQLSSPHHCPGRVLVEMAPL